MLNIRFREKTNSWPGFVDLFSNLVIILIFLLIVFVFLWTTTSVFNKSTGAKAVAELKKTNEEQAMTIAQMTADEQEAKRLLLMARTELENLENDKAALSNEITALDDELQEIDMSIEDLIAAYEAKVLELQSAGQEMQATVADLSAQLNQMTIDKEKTAELEQQRRELQEQMDAQRASLSDQLASLQAALDAAEAKANAQEIQYVEMSNRLNKALADKVAELNAMSQYQSDFYKSIKTALGDRTTIQPDGDRFIVSSDILFASGAYNLTAEGKNQLRLIANVIKDLENKIPSDVNWIIRVDGHTDRSAVIPGTRGYSNNTELSLRRATAVADELARAGVSKRRLVPSGFGEMHPVELGSDAASMQKNRRIELQLTNR
ncbi:MAG: OmpA family protein [Alphaproteobacteria bacterium]|nr:OmpA family protein [Alphaproteobacteria bacterium]MDE6571303.1 OmpA family protein [Alphaproteobacteria bacterium]